MASISFDLMTTKLFNIQDVFNRLDPKKFAEVMDDAVLLLMDKVINEVAEQYMPDTWADIPQEVKNDIVVTADSESNNFMATFMKDMQTHVDDVVDIKEMCVNACVENKHLIVKIFLECGDKEFTFIRRSGFYFGFVFGLFQMLVWFFYPASWILPVAGFLVGWLTNWLALKVIFKPIRPLRIFGFTVQGIFMRRQKEVSEIFARVICVEILHIQAIWTAIFNGRLKKNFNAILRAHTLVFTDKLVVEIEPLAVAALGSDKFLQMKEDIAKKVMEKIPDIIDSSYEYTQTALDMEATIRDKMAVLPPEDFEVRKWICIVFVATSILRSMRIMKI
jgi:hypothetical protein